VNLTSIYKAKKQENYVSYVKKLFKGKLKKNFFTRLIDTAGVTDVCQAN
jgi:hypothetical protein